MKKATHFKIIGLRSLIPTSDDYDLSIKVQSMQKALFLYQDWLYIYKGYDVDEDLMSIRLKGFKQKVDFSIYDTSDLKISVGAVVGKNGSGKSSFVELLIRVINNLTAALLGERFNFAKAEHLHYIDDVYADLLVQIENKFIIISVRGRNLNILWYRISEEDRYLFCLDSIDPILHEGARRNSSTDILKRHAKGRSILRRLFYTLVFNYSLYGFNFRDFYHEETPAERLKHLRIDAKNNVEDEKVCWLGGIFHKNDGYQTPIVLHPLRQNGQLNILKENRLAKERLLSMLFYKDADDNYPCRTINESLHIIGIKTSLSSKGYSRDNMIETLGINKTQNVARNLNEIYEVIKYFWDIHFKISEGCNRPYYTEACDYLVYKTLKIVHSYKKYSSIFRFLSKSEFARDELLERLEPLLKDCTHITKKLRQTINYLLNPTFNPDQYYIDLKAFENIQIAEEDKVLRKFLSDDPVVHLPPPIFKTDLLLIKQSDEEAQRNNLPLSVPFSGLSSGERQVAYTISNILYHLTNIDSEWFDEHKGSGKLAVIKYKYANIILDEIELYFHPEMQRQFVFLLIDSIRCVNFRNLKGINILFVTHSPFILSDIPSENVLALGDDNDSNEGIKTFGANIIEMLADTFFMNSSLGESVRREISNLVDYHIKIVRNKEKDPKLKDNFIKNKARFDYVCENLSDDMWKNVCANMIEGIKAELSKPQHPKVDFGNPFTPSLF